jgi:polygalacturonase
MKHAPSLTVLIALVGACVHSSEPAENTQENASGTPSCDVHDFGAKGDGVSKDTAAIQAAIDACAGKGGTVHLRQGTFLSGMIRLKSSMTFHVHGGATLLGSHDDADYPDTSPPTTNIELRNCKKALVYAESANDLHVTGAGTIDGNGNIAKWLGSSKKVPEAQRPDGRVHHPLQQGDDRRHHGEELRDVERRELGDGQPRHPEHHGRLDPRGNARRD